MRLSLPDALTRRGPPSTGWSALLMLASLALLLAAVVARPELHMIFFAVAAALAGLAAVQRDRMRDRDRSLSVGRAMIEACDRNGVAALILDDAGLPQITNRSCADLFDRLALASHLTDAMQGAPEATTVTVPDLTGQARSLMLVALPRGRRLAVVQAAADPLPVGPADGRDALLQLLDAVPVAMMEVAADGAILHANPEARRLLQLARDPPPLDELLEGLGLPIGARLTDLAEGRTRGGTETARQRRVAKEAYLQLGLRLAGPEFGDRIIAVLSDATELKALEAKFVQSQKMQAVGQLAGGVAHDFNNLLTAISGHCDLLLLRHHRGDSDYGDLVQIRQNTNRAAALVRQLLAFSRKQTLQLSVFQLRDILSELTHLMDRLLGANVTLRMVHGQDLHRVRVDRRQLEQVVMNLVVNARDAMPAGGEVQVETRNTRFETETVRDRARIHAGDYVQIDVRDRGVGIPPDQIEKIFEPFFTTKPPSEGTGLGLSTVYGIVKQSGGFIFVDSSEGEGTCFTIYLPAYTGPAEAAAEPDALAPIIRKSEAGGTILLVEDEVPVRSFAARALQLRGYQVIEAGTGEEALEKLADAPSAVDLVVSDIMLPGLDGPGWVRAALESHGPLRVIFISGYSESVLEDRELGLIHTRLLQKPFSLQDLSDVVADQIQSGKMTEIEPGARGFMVQ
ncbi:PAS domain-containing sensor histidine kinase [Oceanomicrobium pacificus]|uniref:histidine kinase n=1 Tax=Oceanomicrobium pacificus TaxID=2692916 RepID=A0A6B0TZ30_9RHOB|nr:PAS domain-containing sensor histidine kinase [Oceanomicrobium pacificus]MXU66273.1 response regulator [Oceanomicrobium pacificus]